MFFTWPTLFTICCCLLVRTCRASVPFRPETSLLSEVPYLSSINTTVFDGLSLDSIWTRTNTLVITPDTDGVTFSCRNGNQYTLGLDTTLQGAFQLADYLLGGPILISTLLSPSCASLQDMSLFGDIKEMPADWQAEITGEPDLQYAVVTPLSVTNIEENGVTFTGAMRDYHELAGALVQSPDSPAYWLAEGNLPWEYYGENLARRGPLAVIVFLAGGFLGSSAAGGAIALGVKAVKAIIS